MSNLDADKDRRREERLPVNIQATLMLENKTCACVVLNMSSGGLLLRFDEPAGGPVVSQDDIGRSGTVAFGTEEKSQKSLHCKIIRVFLNGSVRVVALSTSE